MHCKSSLQLGFFMTLIQHSVVEKIYQTVLEKMRVQFQVIR